MKNTTLRLYYVDWLRLFAVFLLFIFHTACVFKHGYFYIHSPEPHTFFTAVTMYIGQFHMHLFILLAGIASFYAMEFRSNKEYLRERFKRLFIPLLFGTLVLIAPLSYIRLLNPNPELVWPNGYIPDYAGPEYSKSYLEFYPDFFNGVFPNGNFEWGHLWFLAYLFVFSIICTPIFRYFKQNRGKQKIEYFSQYANKWYFLPLLFIPLVIVEGTLRGIFPNGLQNLVYDWANFLVYLILFIYGFFLFSHQNFLAVIDRSWKIALILAISVNSVQTILSLNGVFDGIGAYSPLWFVWVISATFTMGCWLVFFLGFGKRFLDKGGKILDYLRDGALPYYILHQVVIIFLGFYILQWNIGVFSQFIIILVLSLFITLLIYDILIRRFNPIRFVFGLKQRASLLSPPVS